MLKYFIIFIALLNVIYAQESTTNQTKTSEYTFTYEKENNFNISDTNALNEVSIMIERRGLPLVNRLVRFTSLKPDVFTFENTTENEISLKEMEEEENTNEVDIYTNVYVVPTDENGVAKAKLNLKGTGEGVVLMHILYVGSTGNTNISYEEFAHVNVYDDNDNFSYKILNGDGKSINVKGSMIMTLTLFPALFLVAIALILISYFKHIYDEYRTAKSKIIMYTFFGFSAIKKNFKLMMIIILIELIIVASFMFLDSYIFSVLLIAFFIAGFIVKREKIYSIAFFILACISMIYLYLQTFMNYLGLECLFNSGIMGNPVFIFLLFIILTALSGGIYIPLSILVLYKTIFNISDLSLIMALIGIFIASVLYIVKVKKDIPFLYSLNLLKIKD
ncbi:hypothetical protein [Brachyspira alvinipulli]|uniref:hypothetical protein n=1 Tax=Brachyspira alvinipulli TaxID=84379 RepID=UPI000487BB9C|nr:hypothetical protein [Brachyspira alvinipulli]